jgi:hypothetical protein
MILWQRVFSCWMRGGMRLCGVVPWEVLWLCLWLKGGIGENEKSPEPGLFE